MSLTDLEGALAQYEDQGLWDYTHKDLPTGEMIIIHHKSSRRETVPKERADRLRKEIDQIDRLWKQGPGDRRYRDVHAHIDALLAPFFKGEPDPSAIREGECDKRKPNKPWRTPGERKKFAVCGKNSGDKEASLVRFGDPNMEIKRDDPKRRKNFRARHNCDTARDKKTPRYWSCQGTWHPKKTVSSVVEADPTDLFPHKIHPLKPDKDTTFSRYDTYIDDNRGDERRALYHGGPQKIRNQTAGRRSDIGEGDRRLSMNLDKFNEAVNAYEAEGVEEASSSPTGNWFDQLVANMPPRKIPKPNPKLVRPYVRWAMPAKREQEAGKLHQALKRLRGRQPGPGGVTISSPNFEGEWDDDTITGVVLFPLGMALDASPVKKAISIIKRARAKVVKVDNVVVREGKVMDLDAKGLTDEERRRLSKIKHPERTFNLGKFQHDSQGGFYYVYVNELGSGAMMTLRSRKLRDLKNRAEMAISFLNK